MNIEAGIQDLVNQPARALVLIQRPVVLAAPRQLIAFGNPQFDLGDTPIQIGARWARKISQNGVNSPWFGPNTDVTAVGANGQW